MNQDNIRAYASFSVIGGNDYEGECVQTLRFFASYEVAIEYARGLNAKGFDYSYVMGVPSNGEPDLKRVLRVAGDAPSFVDLEW